MSDERAHEFVEEDFGGGEEVSENEEEFGEGEEMEESGEEEDDLGEDEEMDEAIEEAEDLGEDDEFEVENEVGEGEEFGAENEVREREELGEEGESHSVENDVETMSVSSPNKRNKEMSIDRLPEPLLLFILSFLDTKEAVITSVLSKKWQFLWMFLPWLKFCERSKEPEKIRKFVAWVRRTLVICNGNGLSSFEVEFTYDSCFASDVNLWVGFAVKNKVKGFSLVLNSSSCEDFYTLPQMMFYNSSLTRLHLKRCVLAPRRTIEWRSLIRLYLQDMEVPQHVIEQVLSSCLVLSNLLLVACWGFNRLEVNFQTLDVLGVENCEGGNNEPLLEISAPLTRYLIITQSSKRRLWRLTNIPSVVRANIDLNGSDWDASSVEVMSKMKDLFENLQHVKKLELGPTCIEVLSMLVGNGWQLPQSRLGCLKLYASSDEHNIPGIVGLLESSPNLERLVLTGFEPSAASITLGPAARHDLDCDLLHLKNVHITIYPDPNLAGEPMITLAQILLKRATVLEKIVIDVEYTNDFVNVIQTLLGYPRSSPNAVIILR